MAEVLTVREQDFHQAWVRACKLCEKYGTPIVFGTKAEPKHAIDTCQRIILTGNALDQIRKRQIHPDFPFKQIGMYCDEYTREYLEKYLRMSGEKRFAYLYFERFANYAGSDGSVVDQLKILREQLQEQIDTQIVSNRVQLITWQRKKDDRSATPPCLQSIWPRLYLPANDNDVLLADVHNRWRSRDLVSAWQANLICVLEMLDREVFGPLGITFARIIDDCDSLHAYLADAWIIKKLQVNPQLAYLYE